MPHMQVDSSDGWPTAFVHRHQQLPAGVEALVAEVLRAPGGGVVPFWPNRACRYADPHVFDAATREDCVSALRCCAACRVLEDCYRWAEEQQHQGQGRLNCVAGGDLWGDAKRWLK
jgi:hypothetical protein